MKHPAFYILPRFKKEEDNIHHSKSGDFEQKGED